MAHHSLVAQQWGWAPQGCLMLSIPATQELGLQWGDSSSHPVIRGSKAERMQKHFNI